MRYIVTLIISTLLLAAPIRAVSALPNTDFRTTSSYMGSRTCYTSSPASYTVHRTPGASSYTIHHTPYTGAVGSLTAISASNFAQLNSEGGACYQASAIHKPAARRGGRDEMEDGEGDGGNAIGVYDFHSPVGDTPWMVILLLLFAYVIKKQYLCRRFGNDELSGPVK